MKNIFEHTLEYAKYLEILLYGVAKRTGKSIEDVYLDAKRKAESDGVSLGDVLEATREELDEKAFYDELR